jgi:hypothetical protein
MTYFELVPDARPMREIYRVALRREVTSMVGAPSRRWHRPGTAMALVLTAAAVGVTGAAAAGIYIASKHDAKFTPISVPPQPSIPQALGVISTTLSPPFSSADYVTGYLGWANKTSTQFIEVFAGSPASNPNNPASNPNQGVVIVFKTPLGNRVSPKMSFKVFPASPTDGPLTMTSSNGWVLTLRAKDGATFYFDVSSEAYVPKA